MYVHVYTKYQDDIKVMLFPYTHIDLHEFEGIIICSKNVFMLSFISILPVCIVKLTQYVNVEAVLSWCHCCDIYLGHRVNSLYNSMVRKQIIRSRIPREFFLLEVNSRWWVHNWSVIKTLKATLSIKGCESYRVWERVLVPDWLNDFANI